MRLPEEIEIVKVNGVESSVLKIAPDVTIIDFINYNESKRMKTIFTKERVCDSRIKRTSVLASMDFTKRVGVMSIT